MSKTAAPKPPPPPKAKPRDMTADDLVAANIPSVAGCEKRVHHLFSHEGRDFFRVNIFQGTVLKSYWAEVQDGAVFVSPEEPSKAA